MILTDITCINLTAKSIDSLDHLLGLIEIPRFKRNLRNLLFQYLIDQHDELMPDFGHFIEDMKFVFDFLDTLEKETNLKGQTVQKGI